MAINEHNYEAWFLDYAEGNLSEEQVAQLMAFVEARPELAAELEEFELMALEAPEMAMMNPAALKMPDAAGAITESLADDLLIGELEGTLTAAENKELTALVAAHPILEADRALYKQTVLVADTTQGFGNKAGLKRGGVLIPLFVKRAAAIAAVLLFLAGAFQVIRVGLGLDGGTSDIMATNFNWSDENRPPLVVGPGDGWGMAEVPFVGAAGEWKAAPVIIETNLPLMADAAAPVTPQDNAPARFSNMGRMESQVASMLVAHKQDRSIAASNRNKPQVDFSTIEPEAPELANNEGYFTLKELVVKRVKKRVAQPDEPKKLRERLTLANAVNMAGRITGFKVKMDEKFDKDGNREAFTVASKRFEISRTIGKSGQSMAPVSNKQP